MGPRRRGRLVEGHGLGAPQTRAPLGPLGFLRGGVQAGAAGFRRLSPGESAKVAS